SPRLSLSAIILPDGSAHKLPSESRCIRLQAAAVPVFRHEVSRLDGGALLMTSSTLITQKSMVVVVFLVGVNTAPRVTLFAVSGFRSTLPPCRKLNWPAGLSRIGLPYCPVGLRTGS